MFDSYPNIEAVIHFAAFKHVGESQSKPLEYYENNLCGSINLLKAMRKHNVKRLRAVKGLGVIGSVLVLLHGLRRCCVPV